MLKKEDLLAQKIEHVDVRAHNPVSLVEAMSHMAFTARDLARAAEIYDRMLADRECGIILCLPAYPCHQPTAADQGPRQVGWD